MSDIAALLAGPITKDVVGAWGAPADVTTCWYCWRPLGEDAVRLDGRRYCDIGHAARDQDVSPDSIPAIVARDERDAAVAAVAEAEAEVADAVHDRRGAEETLADAEADEARARERLAVARTRLAAAERLAAMS